MSATTTTTLTNTRPQDIQSWKSLFAKRLAAKKITEEFDYFDRNKSVISPPDLLKDKTKLNGKVCIVGAGMSGLYIAMILDTLNIPGLSYEILEADNRVGGRVYTYKFSDDPDLKHDYYDVGAMRFPRIPIMEK
ncbi:MAG: hypothetical protein Q9191_007759 [Dirinaria sp. TL-2023a]